MLSLALDDEMPVGKYKGELVSHVLAVDLEYSIWFMTEVENYEFEDDIIVALESDCSAMAIHELLQQY